MSGIGIYLEKTSTYRNFLNHPSRNPLTFNQYQLMLNPFTCAATLQYYRENFVHCVLILQNNVLTKMNRSSNPRKLKAILDHKGKIASFVHVKKERC